MTGQRTRTNEGGSVASFVVIGLILVAVVIGGIYIVQKRGENTQVAGPATSSSPAASPSASSSAPPAASSAAPAQSSTPPVTNKVQPSQPQSPAPKNQPMPATGPSDYLPGGLMFAVLIAVIVGYLRSQWQLRIAFSEVD